MGTRFASLADAEEFCGKQEIGTIIMYTTGIRWRKIGWDQWVRHEPKGDAGIIVSDWNIGQSLQKGRDPYAAGKEINWCMY